MRPTAEQIEALAQWWADVIRAPKFDAGADSVQMLMAQSLATSLAIDGVPSPDEIAKFKAALVSAMRDAGDQPPVFFSLAVDYHPGRLLVEAAHAAGIPERRIDTMFPWKTWTRIDPDGTVHVRYGYRASWRQIYPVEVKA